MERECPLWSVAVIEYIPIAAVQAAPIGGKAELAIRRKQSFASGKSQETTRELERKVLADINHLDLVCCALQSDRDNRPGLPAKASHSPAI